VSFVNCLRKAGHNAYPLDGALPPQVTTQKQMSLF
jgi:hypothetical protein